MNPVLLLLLSCTLIHCIQAAFFDPNSCTNTTPCVFVSPNGVDTNNGTSGFPLRTIQKAFSSLATTTTATTIVLADGTYPGDVTWSGNSVSLTSLNGPASTFIDCHQQSNRGVYLLAFAEPLSGSISGVTIQNCRSNMGAGIAVMGFKATMSISNCIFVNNYINQTVGGQTVGGAISVQQAAIVTITRCTFINNTATMYGGAIGVATRGVVTVTNSIFDGNQAQQGSVLYDDATSRAIITGCHTRNNVAHEGGILLLNPFSATKFNITSNTYENNLALGNYGADYGSYASSLAFVPNNSTDIGFSGTTPSILPANTTPNFTQEGFDLPSSSFTLILVLSEFLVLDTFGQRYVSLNSTDYYASIVTLPNNNTAPPTPLLPQMLFASTQLNVTQGMGSSKIIIVGEMGRLYALDFTLPVPGVTPIRIFVTIKPCPALDIVTLYQGSFPICVHPETVYVADALYTGILVMSCILIACVFIVQALTVYYWHTPVIKGSTPLFMSLMLLGAIIGYLATILSVLDINHSSHFDAVCKSEYWMMGVAFVLMFGTLALKTWRIRNIFCNESLSEIRRNVTTMSLLRWLCLLLAIEMLIHILWISIDPLTASLSLTSSSTLTSTCSSNYGTTFLIVNLVSKGLIAAVCVGYAYQTRDVASRFNESRQLMVASYNMFVCVIVIAALALSLPSMDARRTAYSVGALVVITSTWCVLFIPKLYIAMYKSHENVPSMGSPGSGGKNSNNSNGKNSNSGTGTTNSGKASTGKSTHTYTHTAPQSSKSSFNNGIMLTSLEYGSSSKACSTTNTAPGSPVLPLHKLSPQNNSNSVRVSVSSMGSPLTIGIPKGSSPLLQSTMLHIPRHVGTPLPRPLNVHDDMLDTTTSSIDIEPLPSAGPDMINVQTPPPSSRQGGLQPAKNFI